MIIRSRHLLICFAVIFFGEMVILAGLLVTKPFARKQVTSREVAQIADTPASRVQASRAIRRVSDTDSPDLVTVILTGDVLLARTVNYQIQQRHDPGYPFEETAAVLQSADLTFVNLENPLVADCPPTNAGMIFCGDPENAQGLAEVGIDLVAVTNNHALDYGADGLAETVAALEEVDVTPVGQGELVVREIRGRRFGFLAYDTLKSRVDLASVAGAVSQAKQEVDFVLVYFHWGEEYTSLPTDRQRELGHAVIDAGADAVIGSHPHWIQGVELYQGKPIIYSLGNFVFDQGWSEKTQEGTIARLSFDEEHLVDWEFLPVKIENWSQPRFLEGEEKEIIIEEMEQLNADLNP